MKKYRDLLIVSIAGIVLIAFPIINPPLNYDVKVAIIVFVAFTIALITTKLDKEDDIFLQKWQQISQKGYSKYLIRISLTYALIIGGSFIYVMFFIGEFTPLEIVQGYKESGLFRMIILPLLIFGGGSAIAVAQCNAYKNKYERILSQRDKLNRT